MKFIYMNVFLDCTSEPDAIDHPSFPFTTQSIASEDEQFCEDSSNDPQSKEVAISFYRGIL